jgi:hypothetical protein
MASYLASEKCSEGYIGEPSIFRPGLSRSSIYVSNDQSGKAVKSSHLGLSSLSIVPLIGRPRSTAPYLGTNADDKALAHFKSSTQVPDIVMEKKTVTIVFLLKASGMLTLESKFDLFNMTR